MPESPDRSTWLPSRSEARRGRRGAGSTATRVLLALLLLVGLVGLRAEGQDNGASRGMRGSLAGKFLVATEELRDPRFARSVVYMVRHDRSGAMGLIVNRLLGVAPLAELLTRLELDPTGVSGDVRMHYGGPVEPGRGFALHTGDYATDGTIPANDRISFTINPDILRAIGLGKGPRLHLVAFGYAGWAPGQLEAEIARGDWISVPADEDLIFDTKLETKWERAMARRVFEL